ncbi:MAG: DUF4906 domain-containing protein [Bacteroidales bacterium]|nr:DUF4906 domain-containing protein [Bacteroidales bacterium]
MKSRTMKGNVRGIVLAILLGCTLSACRQDPLFEGKDRGALEIDESNLVDARLNVTLNGLGVNSSIGTRVAEPSDEEEPVSAEEERVIDMWVFQYSASTEQLVIYPRYYTVENQEDLKDFPVELSDGVTSYIYVVTNTHDQTWANSDNYTKFSSISDLQEQTLSDPNSVMLGESNDVVDASIPMEGVSEEATPRSGTTITVPVTRMYAKLKIRIHLAEVLSRYYEAVEVNYVEVDGIPYYCRIGSLESNETETEGAVSFPSGTEFHTRAFNGVEDADEDSYPYVIYVPENLRGENANTNETPENKGDLSPANALSVTVRVIFNNYGSGDLASSTSTYHYTVYPGGNSYNNFNIRRNNVYRVTVNVGYPSEEIPEPSANCICGFAGETLSFYPYYREETGSDYYDFSEYLDPTVDSKTIKGLKIIWQMAKYPERNTASSAASYKRCIGDNSAGDKVQLVYNPNQEEEIYRWKIYVATQAAGNALIAAYADEECAGDILWSWHIWVRDREDGDPSNIANALTYYTYHWDEDGIDTDKGHTRELGYPVMDCNLGALANDVTSTSPSNNEFMLTCGLDYQWGRKDPFPAPRNSTLAYNSGNAAGSSTQNNIQTYDNSDSWINLDGSTGCVDATNSAGETPLFNAAYANTIGSTNAAAIAYTVKNPTTFISTYTTTAEEYQQFNISDNYLVDEDGSIGDWLPYEDDCLWGGTDDYTKDYKVYTYSSTSTSSFEATLKDNFGPDKTIFDPCPYGWRVSPGDIWIGFTNTGMNTSTTSTSYDDETDYFNCSDSNLDISTSNGYHFYMQGWMSGQTSWFPIQGTRQPSGQAQGFQGCGNYHNATAERELANVAGTPYSGGTTYRSQIRRVDILHIHSSAGNFVHTFENQLRYTIRSVGGPVRCVRDTK